MLASARKADVSVLLADKWEGSDPTGWWVSEKLDGVRCLWDGRRLLSRLGNEFPAPRWVLDSLPAGVTLDGELWLGRGKFQECVSVVKSASADKGWDRLTFMVFDMPDHGGTFEARMAELTRDSVPRFPSFVSARDYE